MSKSIRRRRNSWWQGRVAVVVAVMMALLFSGTAFAAQVVSGDPYILPRGEVVNDDLYVTGGEVILDGTVEGDVVVAAGYVEINGVVMGDLLATGGAVVIAGAVQDDVRVAGGGVTLSGTVGDDFFGAAGGGWPGMMAVPAGIMRIQGREVPLGLQINAGSTIGGDAFVTGGQGEVAGSIGGNLAASMGILSFTGKVAGDANLSARQLTVQESAVVQGELRYTTPGDTAIPEGVAASVVAREVEADPVTEVRNPVWGFLSWLLRTALVLAGYLLAGWLFWSFARRQITEPVAVIEERPMEAAMIGLLAAVAVVPVGAALFFLASLFWGWFPGGAIMLTFVLGLVSLLWLLSPLITGLWVGRKVSAMTGVADGPGSELPRLLIGIAVIVLLARVLTVIPCAGDVVFLVLYLASLALSVGGWFLARRRPPQEPALLPVPVAPTV